MWKLFKKKNTEKDKVELKKIKPKKTGLIIKVEPFTQEANYYCIKYKMPKSINLNRMEEAFIKWDKESLCSLDHPMLFKDFDNACKFAESLTIEKIQEHNRKEKEKYDNHIKKIRLDIKKRNKSKKFNL